MNADKAKQALETTYPDIRGQRQNIKVVDDKMSFARKQTLEPLKEKRGKIKVGYIST